jgi:hypothetical protein
MVVAMQGFPYDIHDVDLLGVIVAAPLTPMLDIYPTLETSVLFFVCFQGSKPLSVLPVVPVKAVNLEVSKQI